MKGGDELMKNLLTRLRELKKERIRLRKDLKLFKDLIKEKENKLAELDYQEHDIINITEG